MKRARWMLCLLALAVTCGCRTRYEITLNSGSQITSIGKPKLVQGFYVFKDATGKQTQLNPMRVRRIEPQQRGWSKEPTFTPTR